MRLPDELYWDLTPREIHGCIIAYYRDQDTWNMRFGTVAAQAFNVLPSKKGARKKMLDWTAFFKPITSRVKGTLKTAQQDMKRAIEAVYGKQ